MTRQCMTILRLVPIVSFPTRLDLPFLTWRSTKSNVFTGPKLTESTRRIYRMVEIAQGVGRQLTVIIFDGESFSPVCLLEALHSRVAVSWITIHTPEEAERGVQNRVYCCSICAYVGKSNYAFLNHIIVGHYWGSFSCRKCQTFAAATAQQMKRHLMGCEQSQLECCRVRSACHEAH